MSFPGQIRSAVDHLILIIILCRNPGQGSADGQEPLPSCIYTRIPIPLIMPQFIILGKLTDKAIEKMKEAKQRDRKAEEIIRSAGGRVISYYYTFGRYDFVETVELPSAEVLAEVILKIAKCGNVSTETMTALQPEEIYKMATAM
jgi:uncharacterized protein with GYD domain